MDFKTLFSKQLIFLLPIFGFPEFVIPQLAHLALHWLGRYLGLGITRVGLSQLGVCGLGFPVLVLFELGPHGLGISDFAVFKKVLLVSKSDLGCPDSAVTDSVFSDKDLKTRIL